MARRNECISMLLAGGQGSRLGILTKTIAKPAVPFGGKYRIIDFPLSNCVNSGIYTVGVLTQYQPLELNDYIGNGEPWDLDRTTGGVHILSPYQKIEGTEWYKGTANAIYQNIHFIDKYSPTYVAILSGDHIYKMDYAEMLSYHKVKKAACTIAMLEVDWNEASRFGLMLCDDDGTITEFEEKPENPRSNKASMGVYIFTWEKLRKYLLEDEANPNSTNDFGKDVIPAMHKAGEKMVAYPFKGYWRDVGTIESLWTANMDLLTPSSGLDLDDPSWKIYARSPSVHPHFVSDKANIKTSMVSKGCEIDGNISRSIIFANTTIEEDSLIESSIIMPGATIKKSAKVFYSIIGENAVIDENATIGAIPEKDASNFGISVVGENTHIAAGSFVAPNKMIDEEGVEVNIK